MKTTIAILALALSAFAAAPDPPKLSDADKLAIREAQIASVSLAGQLANAEATYLKIRDQLREAQEKMAAMIAEKEKACGCKIDPNTLTVTRELKEKK